MSRLGNVITSWLSSRRTMSRGFPCKEISLRRFPSWSYKRILGLPLSARMILSSRRQTTLVIQGEAPLEPRFTPKIFWMFISIPHCIRVLSSLSLDQVSWYNVHRSSISITQCIGDSWYRTQITPKWRKGWTIQSYSHWSCNNCNLILFLCIISVWLQDNLSMSVLS